MVDVTQSREVLTPGETKKCHVSKKIGVILSLFFVSAIVSTAMLAVYLTPSEEVELLQKTNKLTGLGYSSDETINEVSCFWGDGLGNRL